ncbi:hypothetical protein CYMTET_41468 [Cymbomonas tetramitiformis]|uniref:Uncharacterized protein n=1 Tax=Cymbomonas tetramitiformis TaxID=36881 RepID=A0AAE0C7D9_9CHLO|nr:hypothetical protein CYMTET_41468 [Cymbomonas tetramitiformis]
MDSGRLTIAIEAVSWFQANYGSHPLVDRVCCYMLCAALCPRLHTVVLSERPYSDSLVPQLGGAIAYHPSVERGVPPTVAVLAQDLSRCCGVEYDLACDQLMRCNTLVAEGFVALNVDPLGIDSQKSVRVQGEAFVCKCKMIDLLRACIGASSSDRVSLVCLGSSASAVGSAVHSSLSGRQGGQGAGVVAGFCPAVACAVG